MVDPANAQPVQPVQPINDGNNDGNVPIHHAQAVQGADGGINLKVEQTKLPEFWGKKEKDSITLNAFIQRVDNMMAANGWSDHIAFWNFALVLRGSADTWLKSQEMLEDITGDHQAWTIVRLLFKAEFALNSNDKLILDGLAHLAMKPSVNVWDYFGRLNITNTIIIVAYDSYTILPQEPVLQNQEDMHLMRPMFDNETSTWPGYSCSTTSGLACRASCVECSISRTKMSSGSTMRSSSRQLRPDAPARSTWLMWLQRTPMTLRLMLSAKMPVTTSNLRENISHNRLAKITNSGRKIDPGDKTTRVTTPIGTARRAFFARCKITDKRSAAKGSKPTSLAWTQMDAHSGQRLMLLTPIRPILWRLRRSPSWIFSDELDGTPTSSSPCHSSVNIESLCHHHWDIQ
jgi:hypothetical protein